MSYYSIIHHHSKDYALTYNQFVSYPDLA